MIELLHKTLLWIHIPFGTLSLILFWIPVGVKKGSPLHRKVGKGYYISMWVVLATAVLMSITNIIMGNYTQAAFLGFLSILTAYPLWYSYEILHQKGEWSDRYFAFRRIFTTVLFISSLGMCLMGGLMFQFKGIGTVMGFFGLIGIPSVRDTLMTKPKAMAYEGRMKMHIKGTIISGIAAYTAFFAFGGSKILLEVLHVHHQWMIVPWALPTLVGTIYSKYMKKKYTIVRA